MENIKEFITDNEESEKIIKEYETNLKDTISVYNYILVAFDTNNYRRYDSEKIWNDKNIASPRRQLGRSSTNITPWKTTEEEKNNYDPPLYYWKYGGDKGGKLSKNELKKYKVECQMNGQLLRLDMNKLNENLTYIPYGSLITDSEKKLMLRTLSIPRVFIEEDDNEYQVYEKNTSEIHEYNSDFDNTESLEELAEAENNTNDDGGIFNTVLKLTGFKGGNKNSRKIKKKTKRKKSRKK